MRVTFTIEQRVRVLPNNGWVDEGLGTVTSTDTYHTQVKMDRDGTICESSWWVGNKHIVPIQEHTLIGGE